MNILLDRPIFRPIPGERPRRLGLGDVQANLQGLVDLMKSGQLQPTYTQKSYQQNWIGGTVNSPLPKCLDDRSAEQIAAALGGSVVQQVPAPIQDNAGPVPTCPFIQLPSGGSVSAADIAYYNSPNVSPDALAQELNQGAAINNYNQQYMQQVQSGGGTTYQLPQDTVAMLGAPGTIGPPIRPLDSAPAPAPAPVPVPAPVASPAPVPTPPVQVSAPPVSSAPPPASQVVTSTPGASSPAAPGNPLASILPAGFSTSSVPTWAWLAGAGVLALMLFGRGK